MIETLEVATRHARVQVLTGGEGPPLMFLHGAGGITADSPFLAALAGRYRVYAPLLPGYGSSEEAPGLRDMLDVTLHTFDVAGALGLRAPVLVGHSMGGMIAAEMAAVAPREVDRLMLIAAAGLWDDAHPIPDIFAMLPHEFPAMMFHDVALGERLMTGGRNLGDSKFLIEFLVANARQLGMAGKLLFPVPDRGLRDRLYRITARTSVVWGREDRLIPLPYAEAFRAGIADADLVVIPDAGHMVTVEKTGAVMDALARLAGAGPAARQAAMLTESAS